MSSKIPQCVDANGDEIKGGWLYKNKANGTLAMSLVDEAGTGVCFAWLAHRGRALYPITEGLLSTPALTVMFVPLMECEDLFTKLEHNISASLNGGAS